MKTIATKKLELVAGNSKVEISLTKYEPDNNKNMKGFAHIAVIVDDKFSHMWDGVKVILSKKDELFLAEAQREGIKNGEKDYFPVYLLPKQIKEDINKLLNETFK